MKLSYKMQGVRDEQMGILLYYKNLALEILLMLSPFCISCKVLLVENRTHEKKSQLAQFFSKAGSIVAGPMFLSDVMRT
jgi:hypothetical protein